MNRPLMILPVLTGIMLLMFSVSGNSVIVLPEKAERLEILAAQELASHIKKMTGEKIPVVTENEKRPASVVYYLGNTQKARKAKLIPEKSNGQGFILNIAKEEDQKVCYISGGLPIGTYYGVCQLLQQEGVYHLTSDCSRIPKKKELILKEQTLHFTPSFRLRMTGGGSMICWAGLSSFGDRYYDFLLRNREMTICLTSNMNLYRKVRFTTRPTLLEMPSDVLTYSYPHIENPEHTYSAFINPKEYFSAHPEYFTLYPDGKRKVNTTPPYHYQMCLSNKEVQKIVKEKMIRWIAEDRKENPVFHAGLMPFHQNDSSRFFCKCPECRKIIDRYGGRESGLQIYFLNAILPDIVKEYPDLKIMCGSYTFTWLPPQGITPHKNILVSWTDLYNRRTTFLPLENPANRENFAVFKSWLQVSGDFYYRGYLLPVKHPVGTFVDGIAEDIRYFHKNGIRYVNSENSDSHGTKRQMFYKLAWFLQMQLLWDHTQDENMLIKLFIDSYYGKAANKVAECHELLRGAIRQAGKDHKNIGRGAEFKLDDLQLLKRCRSLLLAAYQEADTPETKGRAGRELSVIDFELIQQAMKTDRKNLPSLVREYEEAIGAYVKTADITKGGREKRLRAILEESSAFTYNFPVPDELKDIPQEHLYFLGEPHFLVKRGEKEMKVVQDNGMKVMSILLKGKPESFYCDAVKSVKLPLALPPSDGKYHWLKAGTIRVFKPQSLYFYYWKLNMKLPPVYQHDDGRDSMEESPNVFDVWVQARLNVREQQKTLFLSRALLVRKNRGGKNGK